jgi:hypothetical protein
MNRRLLTGMLLVAVGCSNSGGGQDTGEGGSGPAGTNGGGGSTGKGGTTGGAGTTGVAGSPGKGGSTGVAGSPATTGQGGTVASGGSGPAGKGGTTGVAGAAGAPGKGGTTGGGAGTTGTGGSAVVGDQSVLERNKNPSRDGHFIQAGLTQAAAKTMALQSNFAASFTGNMWASPLFLDGPVGPSGTTTGAFFAVTTGNDVIALKEDTGAVLWMKNIGSSPQMNGGSPTCGNIHPLGIISTPVIDATSRTLYVAGAIGTSSIMKHEVHAFGVDDGSAKSGWPVDVSTSTSGSITFDTVHQNQRSALSLVDGIIYVAYGGHIGDCGGYHGWVIGINASNPTTRGAWATGGQGEAIWAAGGMASDGNGVFALTGNRTGSSSSGHQDSEELVRITGTGTRSGDVFYPTSWQTMDSQDADLGSTNPLYIDLGTGSPSKIVVAISKDGHFYIVDPAAMGGMGGQKRDVTIASGAMVIKGAPASYKTAMGTYVAVEIDSGYACPGSASGKQIMGIKVTPGSPPNAAVAWCASTSGSASPIATTTDGTSNPIVWFMSGSTLKGVDGDTGAAVVSATGSCANVRQWSSPIAVKNRIVVGGDNHLCSWTIQ